MSMELKGKIKGCVSENEMFLQWGELHKGEGSYRAILNSGTLSRFSMFDELVVFKNCHFWHSDQTPTLREFRPYVGVLPSRGGLEVERWSDSRTDSASVGSNPV